MVGLVVDGKCDRLALKRQFDYEVHMEKGFNGNVVTPEQIASSTVRLFKALEKRGCTKFVLVTDRENRHSITAIDLAAKIKSLIANDYNGSFEVIVADKMLENWLLGDIENISKNYANKLRTTLNSSAFEATNGKSELKKIYINNHYYKPQDAQDFFNSLRTEEARKNSISYNNWIMALDKLGIRYLTRA